MIEIQIQGQQRLAAFWRRLAGKAPQAGADTANYGAARLVEIVKENASGRPGPEIVTGEYVGSIRILHGGSTSSAAIVGTDAPQGPRLENGFVGIDALGRHYAQPPFPHFRPAILRFSEFLPEMRSTFMKGLK